MSNWLLRRRKLGRGSTRAIAEITDGTFQPTLDPSVIQNGDNVIRWGCTATIPAEQVTVTNKAEAIHLVNNKTEFRRKCTEENVSVPDTVYDVASLSDRLAVSNEKWIVRPRKHAQGRKIFVVDANTSINDFADITDALNNDWYASRFIPKDREFRIYVVKGRVVCVAEKFVEDKTKIAWNHALGGTFRNVRFSDWPLEACKEAVKAFNISGLDFGGVDVIQVNSSSERAEQVYVLEINSAPSLTSRYRQECFSKAFLWLIGGKETPPVLLDKVKGWRRLVHPAISEEARSD